EQQVISTCRAKLFNREILRATGGNHLLFTSDYFTSNGWNFGGDLQRYGLHTMAIAMKKIAGANVHAADLNGASEIVNVSVGVRNRNVSREHLKAGGVHGAQIAHRSIGDHTHAAQRQQNVRVQFTD